MDNRSGFQRQGWKHGTVAIMYDSGLDQYDSCGSDEETWKFEQNLKMEPIGFPDALRVEYVSRMTLRFLAQRARRKLPPSE